MAQSSIDIIEPYRRSTDSRVRALVEEFIGDVVAGTTESIQLSSNAWARGQESSHHTISILLVELESGCYRRFSYPLLYSARVSGFFRRYVSETCELPTARRNSNISMTVGVNLKHGLSFCVGLCNKRQALI